MAANPTSETELQLYRVLQRANLLQYFDTFISQGGDDVEQLCEAGEEEFLEIMALVGMASKPLHVRRLQKALQEWVGNPTLFHQPLGTHTISPPIAAGSILASVQRPYLKMGPTSISTSTSSMTGALGTSLPTPASMPNWSSQEVVTDLPPITSLSSPSSSMMDGMYGDSMNNTNGSLNGQNMSFPVDSPPSGNNSCIADDQQRCLSPNGSPQTNTLTEGQIKALENSAAELAKTLPLYQPKPLNMKKLINKEIEVVMKLPFDHPDRMDLLRKYGAIYGRFDSHRKNEKLLSLHEVSVNEAAAQLCRYHVVLLTRRNDLFPLARQVVRDSGYQYSKGHSRMTNFRGQGVDPPASKKRCLDPYRDLLHPIKMEPGKSMEQKYRELRMSAINCELSEITVQLQSLKDILQQRKMDTGSNSDQYVMVQAQIDDTSSKQMRLLSEQSDLLHQHRTFTRSEMNSALKMDNLNKEVNSDEDEDSIPFPSDGPDGYFPSTERMKADDLSGESLLNEGLRIAEQYGMADFATEIKELGRSTSQTIKQEIPEAQSDSLGLVTNQIDSAGDCLSSTIVNRVMTEAPNTNTASLHSSQS